MKRVALLLCLSPFAFAQDIDLPHTLSNNSVANADQVMANFNALKDGVNSRISVDLYNLNLAIGGGLQSATPGPEENFYGNYNIALGKEALQSNTKGYGNTASGALALHSNTEGFFNTASGFDALYGNTTGAINTATGRVALNRNTTGSYNTASGGWALNSNTTGFFNTAVGYSADVASGNLQNATAIGYNAIVDASNKVRIGNTEVTVIHGQVTLTASSDARLKDRITPVSDGLALINDLNPVSYHRTNNPESDIEMGLLAQEVEATLEKHGLGNSGMVHQPNEDAYMSLRYNDLLAPMITAIQELDAQHQQEVASLQEQLQSQQEELLALVQSQQEQIAQLQKLVEHQFAVN